MDYIQFVRNFANDVVNKNNLVHIDEEKCEELASKIKDVEWKQGAVDDIPDFHKILFEIYVNSVNYCFWYGCDNIRPNDCGSGALYKLADPIYTKYHTTYCHSKFPERFKTALRENRYPMLNERCRNIEEVNQWITRYLEEKELESHLHPLMELANNWKNDPEALFNDIVKNITGYSSDLFLKRTQLIFIQLLRKYGWNEDFVSRMTVPADYQIPRILTHVGVLKYDNNMWNDIFNNKLIPKGSLEEISIRASTIVAVDKIAKYADTYPAVVDTFLFKNRKKYGSRIHLTITTDY